MRGDDARKACPELNLVQVPVAHGKADLTLYRAAGKQVLMQSLFAVEVLAQNVSLGLCWVVLWQCRKNLIDLSTGAGHIGTSLSCRAGVH